MTRFFTNIEPDSELVESIKSAISTSGLLFQPHPEHEEWDTTRPGARPGEVAAFVRDVPDERKSYISLVFHREGEQWTDDPDGEWQQDSWEIIVSRGDGSQDRDVATSDDDAAEIVAVEMQRIVN